MYYSIIPCAQESNILFQFCFILLSFVYFFNLNIQYPEAPHSKITQYIASLKLENYYLIVQSIRNFDIQSPSAPWPGYSVGQIPLPTRGGEPRRICPTEGSY